MNDTRPLCCLSDEREGGGGAGVWCAVSEKEGGGNGYVTVQDAFPEFLRIREDPLGRGNGVVRPEEGAFPNVDAGR